MKIIYNDELNRIVAQKLNDGLREQFKKFATEFVKDKDPHSFLKGIQAAAEYVEVGQDLIVVVINKGVLIFSLLGKTEAQWVAEAQLISKKEVNTPRKVLLKMVMSRLEKIRERYATYVRGGAGAFQRMVPKPMEPSQVELNSVEALKEFRQSLALRNQDRLFQQEFDDIMEDLLKREGADDELVKEAWNLLVAKAIHES